MARDYTIFIVDDDEAFIVDDDEAVRESLQVLLR